MPQRIFLGRGARSKITLVSAFLRCFKDKYNTFFGARRTGVQACMLPVCRQKYSNEEQNKNENKQKKKRNKAKPHLQKYTKLHAHALNCGSLPA